MIFIRLSGTNRQLSGLIGKNSNIGYPRIKYMRLSEKSESLFKILFHKSGFWDI